MLEWLKWKIAGAEMRALHRYRTATYLARWWNTSIPASAETAQWITDVGEGKRGMDIENFRSELATAQRREVG